MTALTEFLMSRIAEDEKAAHRIALPLALTGAKGAVVGPGRVLAECAAKRRIIEAADEATGLDMQVDSEFRVGIRNEQEEPYIGDVILRALARPYAGHPDYRDEWRL